MLKLFFQCPLIENDEELQQKFSTKQNDSFLISDKAFFTSPYLLETYLELKAVKKNFYYSLFAIYSTYWWKFQRESWWQVSRKRVFVNSVQNKISRNGPLPTIAGKLWTPGWQISLTAWDFFVSFIFFLLLF